MAVDQQVDPNQPPFDPDHLQLDQIQGNIVPGFRKDAQDYIFVRFPSEEAGRNWISQLLPHITWANTVKEANQKFLADKAANDGQDVQPDPRSWINVALSFAGLEKINARNRGRFPRDFTSTPNERAARLNDFDRGFGNWPIGGPATEADAVLILGGNKEGDVEILHRFIEGVELLDNGICRGRSLGDGREHFGFKDGLSQPDPDKPDDLENWASTHDGRVVAPGEFVLGYRDEAGNVPQIQPYWGRNGSFLVFRRFQQDVPAFEAEIKQHAADLAAQHVTINEVQLAAKLLGRTKDGALLARDDFSDDPLGKYCPWFAHIRKANPRDRATEVPDKHRIVRRGITYGAKTDADKGLLFVCYQASIGEQFEHIYSQWLGASTFPEPDGQFNGATHLTKMETPGVDPISGWAAKDRKGTAFPREVNLYTGPGPDDFVKLGLKTFTNVTASGYFFAPSQYALGLLAAQSEIYGGMAV